MTDDPMIAALLREREMYVRRDRPEAVAVVDEQLKLRGYEPPKGDKPSRSTPPKGRKTRSTETT
ncbi:hypothetical protein [Streptomyces sp. HGB0020]|jgi:hypothetical protein|uniref:hypothetical protein n=1 Tax=Streptomyces sp. HGB0020 TaxID=1078086 RepID=UPI00034E77D3|nr:hypothetical protein [Streptomyces sp. HGB0020]EPD56360.1 hypothetical protein HMPREF1211_07480 [Streptomyces sp. HGB0020]